MTVVELHYISGPVNGVVDNIDDSQTLVFVRKHPSECINRGVCLDDHPLLQAVYERVGNLLVYRGLRCG